MSETPQEMVDAAKRCADEVNLQSAIGNVDKWVAIRLSDGGSDHTAYDRRAHAVKHQLHESLCMYVKVPPDAMTPYEAARLLITYRKVYDAGLRFTDPEGPEPILPSTLEGLHRALKDVTKLPMGYRRDS